MPVYRFGPAIFFALLAFSLEAPAETKASRPPNYNYFDARMRQQGETQSPRQAAALEIAANRPSARSTAMGPLTAPGGGSLEEIARNHLARQGGPRADPDKR